MMPRSCVLALGFLLTSFACSSADEGSASSTPTGGNGSSAAGSGSAGGGAGGAATNGGGKAGSVSGGNPNAAGSGASPSSSGSSGAAPVPSGASAPGGAAGAGGNAGANHGAVAGATAGGAGGSGGGTPLAGGAGAENGGAGGSAPTTGAAENGSADCPVPALEEPGELTSIAKLPDPFVRIDGSRITKRSEWRCRRQEILKQAEKYIYGEKPAFDRVSGTVTNTQISVHVEALGKSIDFSAKVVLPSKGTAPYPALINVGSSGLTLGESRILDQGVAVIYYNHYDLGKEGQPEASRGQPNPGKFYDIYGGTHSAGLLMAWAWGASRLIDVIQKSDGKILAAERLGVTGCSRNGKGAFAIGVFDERIALTIPHETSTAGVPAYRIVDVLNTERTDHNYFGLNWLSNAFEPFVYENGTSNAVKLPIDSHSLIATVAPRGILILENPHQKQMSAPAGHIAALGGVEVFKALGIEGNLSYHSSVAEMPHCSYKNEYTEMLAQNVSHFLKREGAAPGRSSRPRRVRSRSPTGRNGKRRRSRPTKPSE